MCAPERARLWSVIGVAGALGGCGSGAMTMHPAHTLQASQVALGAGVSGNFTLGEAEKKMDLGRDASPSATPAQEEQAFVEGALARAFLAPGVSPWAGGRVGLGSHTEADLNYAGRSVRGGARHAFEDEEWALSVGAGAAAFLLRPGSQTPGDTPTAGRFVGSVDDANLTGWGLDAPIVAGYRSAGEVLQAWAGTRIGFELASGQLPVTPLPRSSGTDFVEVADVDGTRWYVGGLAGLAVGVSPVWVGIQVDVAYQGLSGTVSTPTAADPIQLDVGFSGITLTPTGVLWGKF